MNDETMTDTASPLDVLILIATQSFKAEELVEEILLPHLQANDWKVESHLVDEAGIDWLSEQQQTDSELSLLTSCRVLLVVASTYGDGDPPHHATDFADRLSRHRSVCSRDATSRTLSNTVPSFFSVFGLGDSTYAHYCAFGKYIDASLADCLGAQKLLPLATGDAAKGNQDRDFQQWCNQVNDALGQALGRESSSTAPAVASTKSPFPSGTGTNWRRSIIQPGSVRAQVTNTEELLLVDASSKQNTQQRSVLHVSLSLPSRLVLPNLRPGDHVGIYPRNDPAMVVRALQWLGIDASMETAILEKQQEMTTWTKRNLSAAELLAIHVNLAGRATPSVLRSLLPFVGTLELRALARDLTQVNTVDSSCSSTGLFGDWVAGRRLTVLDMAILFECRPSLQAFARACGPVQPRLYSVASVNETGTGDATVGLCMAVAEGGLCSNYVANLGQGASRGARELTIFFQKSQFHFVGDGLPALVVAAGSGVGPCLGFINEEIERLGASAVVGNASPASTRPSISQPLSHVRLLFGCRTPSEVLYKKQMPVIERLGVSLHMAFSRIPGQPKVYVQDLIRREAASIGKEIFQGGGRVYVCGRLELLEGVKQALVDVKRITGGLEKEEAQKSVRAMEEQGRILTDCWSVDNPYRLPHVRPHSLYPDKHVVLRLERHHAHDQTTSRPRHSVDLSKVPAWPSYLRLLAAGELEHRVKRAMDMASACVACGRFCETDRLSADPNDWGECRVGDKSIVSSAFPHFGEEECLVGTNGSGTIFFGACNLKCMYCQNWELSAMDEGEIFDDDRLAQAMLMLQEKGCHNINFVSPTHNVAPILRAVLIAAKKGLRLPLVWNTGGYDSVASLRILEGVVDIYMPDAKYASRAVGRKLSKVDNYPEINQAAIKEMHRQVGELQIDEETGLARRGVLVRHLILPCDLAGTCGVAAFLAKEISTNTFTNVMDQYRPEHHARRDKKYGLARKPKRKELKDAHKEAKEAGLERLDGDPKTRTFEW